MQNENKRKKLFIFQFFFYMIILKIKEEIIKVTKKKNYILGSNKEINRIKSLIKDDNKGILL